MRLIAFIAPFFLLLASYSHASQSVDPDLLTMQPSELYARGKEYLERQPMVADSAMMCYLTVINHHEKYENRRETAAILAKCYINAAFLYNFDTSNFKKSYAYLKKASKLVERYDFKDIRPYVYLNIADALQAYDELSGDPEDAASHSDEVVGAALEALESALKAGEKGLAAAAFYNLLIIDDRPSMCKAAGLWKDMPVAASSSRQNKFFIKAGEAADAVVQSDYRRAAEIYKAIMEVEMPEFVQPAMYPVFRWQTSYLRAKALLASGDRIGSRAELEHTMTLVDESEDLRGRLVVLSALVTLADENSNTHDQYLLDYYSTQRRLSKEAGSESENALLMQSKIDDFEEELHAANVSLTKSRQRLMWGGMIGGILVVALCGGLIYTQKKRKYVQRLYQKNLELIGDRRGGINDSPANDAMDIAITDSVEAVEAPDLISEEKAHGIVADVEKIFATPVVLDPDFQLSTLCQAISSNSKYVNYALRTVKDTNFKTMLIKHRIAEACRLLADSTVESKYTVEYVSQAVGFRSRGAFSIAFKNQTGLSPTEFRNAAKREKSGK